MSVDTLERPVRNISPLGLDPKNDTSYEMTEQAQLGIPAISVYSGAIVADIGRIADSMWQAVNVRIENLGIDERDMTFDSLNEIAKLLMGARGSFDQDAKFTNLPEHKREAFGRFATSTLLGDENKLSGGKESRLKLAEELLELKREGNEEQFKLQTRKLEDAIKKEFAKSQGVGVN